MYDTQALAFIERKKTEEYDKKKRWSVCEKTTSYDTQIWYDGAQARIFGEKLKPHAMKRNEKSFVSEQFC